MASNKSKAKVSPAKKTGKSTKSTAGIAKRATLDSRSPKKPMAISGDTMSNYAMYRRGGKINKIKRYQGTKESTVHSSDNDVIKNFVSDKNFKAYQAGRGKEGEGYAGVSNNPYYKVGNLVQRGINTGKKLLSINKKGGVTKAKKFAALAPPYDKITAADRIAGAKKSKKK